MRVANRQKAEEKVWPELPRAKPAWRGAQQTGAPQTRLPVKRRCRSQQRRIGRCALRNSRYQLAAADSTLPKGIHGRQDESEAEMESALTYIFIQVVRQVK